MKKQERREKTTPVEEKDLGWVKGSSGYTGSTGLGDPEVPPGVSGQPGGDGGG
jgi:hypothetical protein